MVLSYVTAVLPVLHQDRHLVVIDKPPGLPVIPGRDQGDSIVKQTGFFVVHRLDEGTSGVLVMARTVAGQRMLSHAFESRQVKKGYLAVGTGELADEGECALPLGDWQRGRVVVGRGRDALTRWTVRARAEGRILIEAHPVTGRTHQVRAHLSASGGALLGDPAYGGEPAPRLALHAWWIEIPWPGRADRLRIESPPPPSFASLFPGAVP
ncbi:MAG: RluA family pseudouridine synthase [Deltaproteobacteria bacterium]|nr:RluA family pseudouridine synthase [Deltaproteobacteria bacterium]